MDNDRFTVQKSAKRLAMAGMTTIKDVAKAAGVSTANMFKTATNPAFLLLFFVMMLTASIELGPGQFLESILRKTVGMSGTMVFVYGKANTPNIPSKAVLGKRAKAMS